MSLLPHHDPLNAQQKEAVRLREEEGLNYREVALRMGVTPERIMQVMAAARVLRRDCAAHGAEALSLLPKRVRDFVERNGLASSATLRAAIESKRLFWDDSRKYLMFDGKFSRNTGWISWQVMCVVCTPKVDPSAMRV